MDNLPPMQVPALLRRYGLKPDKSLGQNFLVDENALQKIAAAAAISPGEAVLEIGPGLGSLTRHLARLAETVVAVELDEGLLPALQETLSAFPNVRLVHGDILEMDPAGLMEGGAYAVVANIPYYITSALMRHLLESPRPPLRLVLTVQAEVAERICAAPGDMSLLALSVQVYGQPRVAAHIPAGAFYPAPKVDSAVLQVALHPNARLHPEERNIFFRLAKAGFSQKRKTLRNSLAAGMGWGAPYAGELLQRAGIDPQRRAETLSLDEWAALAATVQAGETSSP